MYCTGWPHFIKQTTGYWIECYGSNENTNFVNQTAIGNQTSSIVNDMKSSSQNNNDQLLMPTQGIPRSNTSSDGLLLGRSKLERDTSKSTNDMGPTNILQPPTICIENLTKDDIELYTKKQPNIIITIASNVSPPSASPPGTPNKDSKITISSQSKNNQQNITTTTTSTTTTVTKQTEQEFAMQQLEKFKLAAQKGKQITGTIEEQTTVQYSATCNQTANNQLNVQQLISTTTVTDSNISIEEEENVQNELMNINLPTTMPQADKQEQKEEFELILFQEEIYEKHFYGKEHWNYFTSDEGLGSVIMVSF